MSDYILTYKQNNCNSIGIDGCKGGWVVVEITDHNFEIGIFKSINVFIQSMMAVTVLLSICRLDCLNVAKILPL